MSSVLDSYAPMKGEIERRQVGSLIAFESGEACSYGLFNAQERGQLFIGAGTPVYAGMVVGVCSRNEDMTVNVCKKKQLTNMRAAGSDEALRLTPPKIMSLEQCLEFLADDELLECTPKTLRIRKRELDHALRMRNLMKKRAQEYGNFPFPLLIRHGPYGKIGKSLSSKGPCPFYFYCTGGLLCAEYACFCFPCPCSA